MRSHADLEQLGATCVRTPTWMTARIHERDSLEWSVCASNVARDQKSHSKLIFNFCLLSDTATRLAEVYGRAMTSRCRCCIRNLFHPFK